MPAYSDIITRIRTRGGIQNTPSPDSLSDTEITTILADSLVELSTHLPKRALSYITSVAGTQDYVLTDPGPEYVYKIFDESLFSSDASDPFTLNALMTSLTGMDPYGGDPASSIYLNPSQYYAFLQQTAALKKLTGLTHIYNRITKTLSVLPAPTTAKRYYFAAGYTWPIADLPAHYIPVLSEMALGDAIIAVAAKLSRLAGASTAGAPGIYGNLTNLIQLGKDHKKNGLDMAKTMALIEGPVVG